MQRLSEKAIIIYCGLLLALSALSVDITLPALALIENDLKQTPYLIKMTVTVYLLSFGFGQIFFGPFSDRWGRRISILIGLSLYIIGGIISSFAPNIETLLVGRFLQGLGGSTGQVIGRAILRDLYTGRELASNMALAMAIFAIGPILAPLLGYGLSDLAGWRTIFLAMAILGIALLAVGIFRLHETIPSKKIWNVKSMWDASRRFISHRQSRTFFFISACMATVIYFYLINVSQLFHEGFGVSNAFFSISFSVIGLGIIIGQIINRKSIPRIGALTCSIYALSFLTITPMIILTTSYAEILNVYGFIILMLIFSAAFSAVFSNAISLSIDPHGDIAGFASSLIGFGTAAIGTLIASLLSYWCDGDLNKWAFATLCVSVSALIALLAYKKTENVKTNLP